jgi:hypothetical protein
MMPFNIALEANNLGQIIDLVFALILVAFGLIVIGVESKSTLVIGRFLHTQNIIECGFSFMTLF